MYENTYFEYRPNLIRVATKDTANFEWLSFRSCSLVWTFPILPPIVTNKLNNTIFSLSPTEDSPYRNRTGTGSNPRKEKMSPSQLLSMAAGAATTLESATYVEPMHRGESCASFEYTKPKANSRVKRTASNRVVDRPDVPAEQNRASNSSNEKEDSAASNSNSTRSSKKDGCSQTEKLAPATEKLENKIPNSATSSENFERQIRKLLDDQALLRNNPQAQGYVLESIQALAKQQEMELAIATSPVMTGPAAR